MSSKSDGAERASDANRIPTRELTADIVSAFVRKNAVPMAELPGLIGTVHAALNELDGAGATAAEEPAQPAVPVRRSVRDDAITCLECGKAFKSIKRHLNTAHSLTPDEYRSRFGLKPDYPMVAPDYAAQRSRLATEIGLGRKSDDAAAKPARGRKNARKG